MRRRLLLACVLGLTACAHAPVQSVTRSSCSDPLRLYTAVSFQPCCDAHDEAYRVGGNEHDRLTADRALLACVRAAGYSRDAESMFVAVRLFGGSRFRWRQE